MKVRKKEYLIKDLKEEFHKVIVWINEQNEDRFNQKTIPDKWTIAGHLYHLIKSTKAVSSGMAMPREKLRDLFGKRNQRERSYKEMLEKYNKILFENNPVAPNAFQAESERLFNRTSLIERFESELDDLIKVIGNWTEEDLGNYVMPHPVLGKCTLREFIYFSIFHTTHHLNVLKEKYS